MKTLLTKSKERYSDYHPYPVRVRVFCHEYPTADNLLCVVISLDTFKDNARVPETVSAPVLCDSMKSAYRVAEYVGTYFNSHGIFDMMEGLPVDFTVTEDTFPSKYLWRISGNVARKNEFVEPLDSF